VYERLRDLGFAAAIMDELGRVVETLEAIAENEMADERTASARR
jgi:hypothetical protein